MRVGGWVHDQFVDVDVVGLFDCICYGVGDGVWGDGDAMESLYCFVCIGIGDVVG